MKSTKQIKSTLNTFYELCDKLEEKGKFTPSGSYHLKDYARLEFLKYLIYLTKDGNMNVNEVYFINDVLGYDFNTKALRGLYESMIEGKDYDKNIPETLKLLSEEEKVNSSVKGTSKMLIDLYRNLGICYTACDNVAGEDQVYRLTNYVLFLQNSIVGDVVAETDNGEVNTGTQKKTESTDKPKKTTEELLAELNELIGLENVKKDVNSLVNLIKV